MLMSNSVQENQKLVHDQFVKTKFAFGLGCMGLCSLMTPGLGKDIRCHV